jgi:hypothetical protein
MLNLKGKPIIIAVMVCFSILTMACGPVEEDAGPSAEDIRVEVQKVAEATPAAAEAPTPAPPTASPSPSPTLESGSVSLETEIMEPVSPISPAAMPASPVMNADTSVQIIPGSEEPLAAAIADLAQQSGASPDQIKLISMEAVEWNDASLGCPQPGFMYAQVITPGYKIILEAQGQQYEYHTDQKANVVWCQQ